MVCCVCIRAHPAVVEYVFDVLGGEALPVTNNHSHTPLHDLESREGTAHAQPEMLPHLKALLDVPEELPALVTAQRRLALAKALQPRLGGAEQRWSPATWTSHDVMQVIATESGALGERASYHDVKCWGEEQEEEDRAKMQALLSSIKSPKARALQARALQAAVIAQLPAPE